MSSSSGSLFPWIGGKRLLAKTVISEMPAHRIYIEVFAGAASIFFKKGPSEVEVINDINMELITFYRAVRNHTEEFYRQLQYMLVSREEFRRFRATPPEVLTDIQKAVRFFYIQKNCFGGKVVNPTFGVSRVEKPRFNLDTLRDSLETAHKRLSRVLVECLPYEKAVRLYDAEDALFYLDPPYFNCENFYGKNFSRDDFAVMRDLLADVKGKFIMSINDVPAIREMFKGFRMKEVTTKYSIGSAERNGDRTELLIMNF